MITPLSQLPESGVCVFPPRTTLGINQYLSSPSGQFKLLNQEDLNLVLYDRDRPVWVAGARERYVDEFYPKRWKKTDRSVVYMSHVLGLTDLSRSRMVHTKNSDVPGGNVPLAAERCYMQLQDDGNMVIIDQFPRWYAPGTPMLSAGLASTIIAQGTMMSMGDSFEIGKSRLIFQGDGNLVFYSQANRVLWASYTHNKGGAFAAMQGDGNFVIYNAAEQPIWATNTAGFPDAYARIQENGCFAIVTDRICWARFGYAPTIKPARKIVRITGNPTGAWKMKDFVVYSF